ncbi:hypothetical protein FOA43_003976 [Brettanomyces nanus]|uniref:Uncharacterized protein n=1 Tax=Eeniella nana TaxID=13502 RepID=A0A875S8S1_EENNA|nr:uncharacterized protein FOA43_003976 [Brettanomyces nanus]QPG76585.1 hypothetical protein FOA43_003976 [Brettanomyces nanus]
MIVPLSVKLFNYYIQTRYLSPKVLRHFIETPVRDVSIKVPSHYECPNFRFPDIVKAIEIQLEGRLRTKEQVTLRFGLEFQQGAQEEFDEDLYNNNSLFVRMLLSDQDAIYVDGARNYAELYYTLQSVESNDLPFFATQLLTEYCFREELIHYSEDSFIKVLYDNDTNFSFIHADFVENDQIRRLMNDFPVNITLKFALLGCGLFEWDIDDAMVEIMPYMNELSNLFHFEVQTECIELSSKPDSEEYVDEKFPKTLTDLPGLAKFYKDSLNDDSNTIHLVLYPFALAGDSIINKTVDLKEIYSPTENTFLKLQDWGSIYFSHSPKIDSSHFTADKLHDCMWSFTEATMDFLNFPNDNMAPILRMEMFERIITINYLFYYSDLLFTVEKWIDENSSTYINGKLVDAVIKTLELRGSVLDDLSNGRAKESVKHCQKMIRILTSALSDLGIFEKSKEVLSEYVSQVSAQKKA